MKFFAAVLTLATAVAAVDISSIPSCAIPCIDKAELSAGCSEGDYSCSCSKLNQIQAPVASCILEQNACDSSELPNVVSAVEAFCASISSESSTAAPSSEASAPATNISSVASSASSTVSTPSTAASTTAVPSSTGATGTGTGASTIPVASGTGASSTSGSVAVPSSSSSIVANGAERVGAAGMAVAAAVVLAL